MCENYLINHGVSEHASQITLLVIAVVWIEEDSSWANDSLSNDIGLVRPRLQLSQRAGIFLKLTKKDVCLVQIF